MTDFLIDHSNTLALIFTVAIPLAFVGWVAYMMKVDARPKRVEPIDMILYCPNCGNKHIDEPEQFKPVGQCECRGGPDTCETCDANEQAYYEWRSEGPWTNPPHRSHLCRFCKHVWRPADVATNGVAILMTRGQDDSPRPMLTVKAVPTARVRATHAGASKRRWAAMVELRNRVMDLPWLRFKRQDVIDQIEETMEQISAIDEEAQP